MQDLLGLCLRLEFGETLLDDAETLHTARNVPPLLLGRRVFVNDEEYVVVRSRRRSWISLRVGSGQDATVRYKEPVLAASKPTACCTFSMFG
jgi:hypothetical protein